LDRVFADAVGGRTGAGAFGGGLTGELQVTVPVRRPESKRRQIPIGGTATEKQEK
jgi:hypothetical protein